MYIVSIYSKFLFIMIFSINYFLNLGPKKWNHFIEEICFFKVKQIGKCSCMELFKNIKLEYPEINTYILQSAIIDTDIWFKLKLLLSTILRIDTFCKFNVKVIQVLIPMNLHKNDFSPMNTVTQDVWWHRMWLKSAL